MPYLIHQNSEHPCSSCTSLLDSATCWECLPGQWPSEQQDRCIPTIFDFLSYTEALGVVLATCSSLFFLLSLSVLGIFIQHHHTPVVKANNHKLSYLLLTSLALCFLCPLMYLGHPSQLTCSFRQAAFGLVFAICLSATLAKMVTVVMAFGASKPGSCLQKWVGYKLPGALTLGCSLVQAAVCVCWITVCPPFPLQNPLHGGPLVTLECDKGSVEFFYTMLGYLGFLATISLGVAFPACQLATAFNEAQHIAISMLVFTFVWVSFVPSYLSATGKYTVAVEIFAILASGAGLLACLFFPKCYIIILHPKKNNRDHLMGRQRRLCLCSMSYKWTAHIFRKRVSVPLLSHFSVYLHQAWGARKSPFVKSTAPRSTDGQLISASEAPVGPAQPSFYLSTLDAML
ncbi:vomeronasal type-2 receptor 26-like [Zootoca vivipara]|uniref:vomeronasal type-2 receptor 26-like n=1 Tax=Zootoca vivipara TaxID=8524 RepID=UPI00159266C5|nr:vomeronasal type-2 receptor 26-like [Zootoca vivipara]